MYWLKQHWKGAILSGGGIMATVIVEKTLEHFLDVSLFAALGAFLDGTWTTVNTTLLVPAWLAALFLLVLAALSWKLYQLQKDRASNHEPNEEQRAVLRCIVWFYQELGSEPAFHNLQNGTNLSALELQVAIDELCKKELITWEIDMNLSVQQGKCITLASLTSKGRAYALTMQKPES